MKRALVLSGLMVAVVLAASGAGARAASSACPTVERAQRARARERERPDSAAGHAVRAEPAGRTREHQRLPADRKRCRRHRQLRWTRKRGERHLRRQRIARGVRRDRRPGTGHRAAVHRELHRRHLHSRCPFRLRHRRVRTLEYRERTRLVDRFDRHDEPSCDRQRQLRPAAAGARHRRERQPGAGRERHVRDCPRHHRRERELRRR